MIELLVVIGVLALLIALVIGVASKAIRQQKVRNTQQIMQNVMLAIEQFATEDPLKRIYDQPGSETFGKYPPYALKNANQNGTVAGTFEARRAGGVAPQFLSERLALDLGGAAGSEGSYVSFGGTSGAPQPSETDGNDDNRALAAYLQVFSPGSVKLIPENARKPLNPQAPDSVNAKGTGGVPGQSPDWQDVLGLHDAWGVPLDYMVYAKLEWGVIQRPNGTERAGWKIVERRAVLRSRGVKREVYDTWVASNRQNPSQRTRVLSPSEKWIFSEPLPKPWAALGDGPAYQQGRLPAASIGGSAAGAGGWVRVVGLAEDYAYRPDGDAVEP